jgi:hypothetical protein
MTIPADPPATRAMHFLSRTFSNTSRNSVASVGTILPEYSITASDQDRDDASTLSNLSPRCPNDVSDSSPRHRPLPQIPLPTTSQPAMPPRYSLIGATPRSGTNQIEHSFPLGGDHKSWATLYTFTEQSAPGLVQEHRAAKRNIPRFLGGGDISGMVELNLEGTPTIQQITLTVCP